VASPPGAVQPLPRRNRACTDAEHLDRFLADWGIPPRPPSRREHVFIVAELARPSSASTATRHRWLQHLFNWLDEREIDGIPMAKMRALEPREAPNLRSPTITSCQALLDLLRQEHG
jgi:hypothetical protein